jgi:putative hydrolase of the HAD superfamily
MNEIHTIFFDLDGTLYPVRNGLWSAIKERIDGFLLERMGFPQDEAIEVRQHYLDTYGTTLRGLQAEHEIDSGEYLAYVHDLPLEQYLEPDPRLRELLLTIPSPKWILTNSDLPHARRVLEMIGIADCFNGIIDITQLEFVCKPDPGAYQKALDLAGLISASGCLLVEDSVDNLQVAKEIGFTTVLVDPELKGHPAADLVIASIHELPNALPKLWNEKVSR